MAEIKLNQVIGMLSIGLDALVVHLHEMGIDVEENPNAMISEELLPSLFNTCKPNIEALKNVSTANINLRDKRTLLIRLRKLISKASVASKEEFVSKLRPEYEQISSEWQTIGDIPSDMEECISRTYTRYICNFREIESKFNVVEDTFEDSNQESESAPDSDNPRVENTYDAQVENSYSDEKSVDLIELKIKSINYPCRVFTEPFGNYKAGVLLPEHVTCDGHPISIEWLGKEFSDLFQVGAAIKVSVLSKLSRGGYAILEYNLRSVTNEAADMFDRMQVGNLYTVRKIRETPNYYIVNVSDTLLKGVVLKDSMNLAKATDKDENFQLQLLEKGTTALNLLLFVKPFVVKDDKIEEDDIEKRLSRFLKPEEKDVISEEDFTIVRYILETYPFVTRANCNVLSMDLYCRVPESSMMAVYLKEHPGYLDDRNFWMAFERDKKTLEEKVYLFHSDPTVVIEMRAKDDNQFEVTRFDSNGKNDTRNIIRYNNRRTRLLASSRKVHFVTRYEAIPADFRTKSVIDLIEKLSDFNTTILNNIRDAVLDKTVISAKDYTSLESYLKYQRNKEKESVTAPVFVPASCLSVGAGTSFGVASLKMNLSPEALEILFSGEEDDTGNIHVAIVDKTSTMEFTTGILRSDGEDTYLDFNRGNTQMEAYLNQGIHIRRRVNTKHLDLQIAALNQFVRNDSLGVYQDLINDRLVPIDETLYDDMEFINPVFNIINSDDNNQPIAVKKAMANENILLIQGPPGTGKTTIIVEIINQLVKEGKKVLVCSQAHAAVENIYKRLDTNSLDILRLDDVDDIETVTVGFDKEIYASFLNNSSKIIQMMLDGIPDEKISSFIGSLSYAKDRELTRRYRDMHNHIVTFYKDQKGLDRTKINEMLDSLKEETAIISSVMLEAQMYRTKDIIMGTCIGVGMNRALSKRTVNFDTVIIDEAGKANLAETIVPMGLGRRYVLVGDHRQLPPFIDRQDIAEYVLSSNEKTDDTNNDSVESHSVKDTVEIVKSLSNSLFADFFNHPFFPDENKVTLNYQFRMNPEIGEYISNLFYEGILKSGKGTDAQAVYIDGYPKPVTFVDTTSRKDPKSPDFNPEYDPREGESGDGSFYNDMEVNIIANDILPTIHKTLAIEPQLQVGIITPYKAQYFRLLNRLANTDFAHCIHTIDSIQGSEFDIVIFSFVRSFSKHSGKTVGFLDDMRRLNVSLSRAKKKLILVGNLNTLQRKEAHNDYGISGMVSPVNVFNSIAVNTKRFGASSDFERFLELNPKKGQIFENCQFEIRPNHIVFDIFYAGNSMRFSMPNKGRQKWDTLDVVYYGQDDDTGKPIFFPADLEKLSSKYKVGDSVSCKIRRISSNKSGKHVLAEVEDCIGFIEDRTLSDADHLEVDMVLKVKISRIDLEHHRLLLAMTTKIDPEKQQVVFKKYVSVAEQISNLQPGRFLLFDAKVIGIGVDKGDVLLELKAGEKLKINFPMLWYVGKQDRIYSLVAFSNGSYAFNDKPYLEFKKTHGKGARVKGYVVNEDDDKYYVEAGSVYGRVSKSFLTGRTLDYEKEYLFMVYKFDDYYKNVVFSV